MARRWVTFSCGHEAELRVCGPHRERERKIEWAETQGLCPDCYRKMKEAEKQEETKECRVRVAAGERDGISFELYMLSTGCELVALPANRPAQSKLLTDRQAEAVIAGLRAKGASFIQDDWTTAQELRARLCSTQPHGEEGR